MPAYFELLHKNSLTVGGYVNGNTLNIEIHIQLHQQDVEMYTHIHSLFSSLVSNCSCLTGDLNHDVCEVLHP